MGRDRASRPEARDRRLFVAVDVPRDIRAGLVTRLEPLRASHPELRWVPEENWHITIKFLGAVSPRLVEGVRRSVATVAASEAAFSSRATGAGAFPSARRARVLWIGLGDAEGRFASLARALDLSLAGVVKPEERAFTAHLTVARAKASVELAEDVTAIEDIRSSAFAVERIVLYRSHLRRPAPVYEAVESHPLSGREQAGGR